MLLLLAIPVLLAAGCVSEEEKAVALRSQYQATLNGFTVLQEPRAAAGEGTIAVEQDVRLDLLVSRNEGVEEEGLAGLTVDAVQLDAAGREKRRWQVWIDTAGLDGGGEIAARPEIEEVDYSPGDRFQVEVRQQVPPAERGGYRELAGGSPAGS